MAKFRVQIIEIVHQLSYLDVEADNADDAYDLAVENPEGLEWTLADEESVDTLDAPTLELDEHGNPK